MPTIVRLVIAAVALLATSNRVHALTPPERECQDAIAVAGRQVLGRSGALLAACAQSVADGDRPAGTDCAADPDTIRRRDAAAARPMQRVAEKCSDELIAALAPAGDCSESRTLASFGACLRASHDSQAEILTAAASATAGALSPAGQWCQSEASRQARRFALARLRLLQRCKTAPGLLELAPRTECRDEPLVARSIAGQRRRAAASIAAACGGGGLDEASFGAPCDTAASAAALAECLLATAESAGDAAAGTEYPDPGFCGDNGEAVERRIDDLLAALTLDEKVAQMHGSVFDGTWRTTGVERLGIPGFGMLDGPRGVSAFAPGNATCFPVGMARGATWDLELEARVGEAMGDEERAKGASVILAPVINILRHPRWGRAQETYGEDTFHLGRMGVAFIRGAQEHVITSPKHYAANSIEDTRTEVDVSIDERSLREIYLRHFEMAVREGHTASLMSAYNQVNGHYCGENPHLLNEILKTDWGYRGFVESDWLAGTRSTVPAANAGLDIEMPFPHFFAQPLADAVAAGDVPEAAVDAAVRRILRAQLCFRLDTDPPVRDPSRVETQEHLDLALEVARRSIVLLRNESAALPLDRSRIASLVVVGPLAATANLGDVKGSSNVRPSFTVAPLDGIRARAGDVAIAYIQGPALSEADRAAIAAADAAVVVAGLTSADEGEGLVSAGDRDTLNLSAEQEALIGAVGAANPRTIVVLEGGSAIAMPWASDVAAILMAWYPGQRGGEAIGEVLFGDVNPSGKLPITFAAADADLPPFDNHGLAVTYGYYHGYRYLDRAGTTPLYPFGFGLSYTSFEYSNLTVSPPIASPGTRVRVTVDVTNTGAVAGDEIVELYVGYVGSSVDRAEKDLKGFARVHLEAGETRTVPLELRTSDLAFYDVAAGAWRIEPIEYVVRVGPSSADLHLHGGFRVAQP